MHRLLLSLALLLCVAPVSAQSIEPLAVAAPDGTVRSVTAAQLAVLPRITGSVASNNARVSYEGYDVREVLRLAGITPVDSLRRGQLRRVVVFIGADGYAALIALSDLDPSIGGRRAVLVDREDGRALPAESAPRRLIVEGDRRPARWVRQVVRLEVRDVLD